MIDLEMLLVSLVVAFLVTLCQGRDQVVSLESSNSQTTSERSPGRCSRIMNFAKQQWSVFGREVLSLKYTDPVLLDEKQVDQENLGSINQGADSCVEYPTEATPPCQSSGGYDLFQLLQTLDLQTTEIIETLNAIPSSAWPICIVVVIIIKMIYKYFKKGPFSPQSSIKTIPARCRNPKCRHTAENLGKLEEKIDQLTSNISSLIEDRNLIFELLREKTDIEIEQMQR